MYKIFGITVVVMSYFVLTAMTIVGNEDVSKAPIPNNQAQIDINNEVYSNVSQGAVINIPKIRAFQSSFLAPMVGNPIGEIVYDPTNYVQLLAMVENLKQQLEQARAMVVQLSKGQIDQGLINMIASNLYSCGFSRMQFPDLAQYIPNVDLNNVCGNSANIMKQGEINLKKTFFEDPDTDKNNPKLSALKLQARKKALLQTLIKSKVIADIQLGQHDKKAELIKAFKDKGEPKTLLDAVIIQNKILLQIANEQINQTTMLNLLVKLNAESN